MLNDSAAALLRSIYVAFNDRDLNTALSMMTPDVAWPRAFKGGFVIGPDAVRAYWTEQWSEINPHVEPVAFHDAAPGQVLVDVHQVVHGLDGVLLADEIVQHRFTIDDGLIRKMEVETPRTGNSFFAYLSVEAGLATTVGFRLQAVIGNTSFGPSNAFAWDQINESSVRNEIYELEKLGHLPSEVDAEVAQLQKIEELCRGIAKPVTDSEARILVELFGADGCYGIAASFIRIIETALGWPLKDCLRKLNNDWKVELRERAIRGGYWF